ncbi:hypothetical protein N7466_001111 [Penicillium verhagenii]|uniref:uncharacterized protein n=1 Tax=Penicillium verhagenii TaxID=1562060 RepID=UPI002544E73D|nr:uncharacterized protein N7466_001111 [Penicillium verhagenii]KAJ5948096.1 hypothetical protein N7466_001111 [Penicillium verhagenii]
MANLMVGLDSKRVAITSSIAQQHTDVVGRSPLASRPEGLLLGREFRRSVAFACKNVLELLKAFFWEVYGSGGGVVQCIDLGQLATDVAKVGEVVEWGVAVQLLCGEVSMEGNIRGSSDSAEEGGNQGLEFDHGG